jgi:hypothetical protein
MKYKQMVLSQEKTNHRIFFSLFSGPAPILLATWADNSTTTISISESEINKIFWKNQNVYEYKHYFMIDVLQGLQNDFQEAMERVDEAYLYDILATIKSEEIEP